MSRGYPEQPYSLSLFVIGHDQLNNHKFRYCHFKTYKYECNIVKTLDPHALMIELQLVVCQESTTWGYLLVLETRVMYKQVQILYRPLAKLN